MSCWASKAAPPREPEPKCARTGGRKSIIQKPVLLGRHVCRTKLSLKKLKLIRKLFEKKTLQGIRKTIRNASVSPSHAASNYLAGTFLKVFTAQNLHKKIVSFGSPRGARVATLTFCPPNIVRNTVRTNDTTDRILFESIMHVIADADTDLLRKLVWNNNCSQQMQTELFFAV